MRISDWSSDVCSSDRASFTVDAQHQHVEYRSGAAPGQRSIYEPDRTSIVADDGQLVGERTSPRASFADHKVTTPWDSQHIIYFSGYAIWTYLTTPDRKSTRLNSSH